MERKLGILYTGYIGIMKNEMETAILLSGISGLLFILLTTAIRASVPY